LCEALPARPAPDPESSELPFQTTPAQPNKFADDTPLGDRPL
jgi:hypothetical protein